MNNRSREKNSQFGTKWILKDGVAKKIKSIDLEYYVKQGWVNERLPKHKSGLSYRKNRTYKEVPGFSKIKLWSESVLKRDDYTCQKCYATKEEKILHAHHILPKKERPDLIYDISNGQTLCRSCHHHHHKLGNTNVLGMRWKQTKEKSSWICKDGSIRRIKYTDILDYLNQGWIRGRKQKVL
uniref:Putative homing endonuclease n=1 Tax=viral metagenome TaxID=1070528 RepID=A0A6M3LY09_9ZZZZ